MSPYLQPRFDVASERFNHTLRQYAARTSKGFAHAMLQRALNIAGHAFEIVPPPIQQLDAQRAKVRGYLGQKLESLVRIKKRTGRYTKRTQKIHGPQKISADQEKQLRALITAPKILRKGPNKGKSVAFKGDEIALQKRVKRLLGRAHPLQRVNLILQKRRGMAGVPGLYGLAMLQAAEKFKRVAVASVGYLKTPFLHVIKRLNPLVRRKYPFAKTRGILGAWQGGGSSDTTIRISEDRERPFVEFHITAKVSGPRKRQAIAMVERAVIQAYELDTADMLEYLGREIKGNWHN